MVTYPLTFKAAILEKNNAPLVIDTVGFAGPLEAGQVLVKIHCSGICGKQIEEIQGLGGCDPYIPHMLGHEGAGTVVDVGAGVKKVIPGDNVVLHWVKGSGIDTDTPLYTRGRDRINAGWITTFNEYAVVPENRVTPFKEDIGFDIACLFGCAITTGVGVIFNDAQVKPWESVLVFGCGGVGLSAIQGAVLARAYPIIAVDNNEASLMLASQCGATHVVNSAIGDVRDSIGKITNGVGAKYVIVAVGNPQAIEVAGELSSFPGYVFLVGVPTFGSRITVDALSVHRQRTFTGSYGGGTLPDRDIPAYIALYTRGLLKVEEMISHVVPFNNINKGIDLVTSGSVGRCVIKMSE